MGGGDAGERARGAFHDANSHSAPGYTVPVLRSLRCPDVFCGVTPPPISNVSSRDAGRCPALGAPPR